MTRALFLECCSEMAGVSAGGGGGGGVQLLAAQLSSYDANRGAAGAGAQGATATELTQLGAGKTNGTHKGGGGRGGTKKGGSSSSCGGGPVTSASVARGLAARARRSTDPKPPATARHPLADHPLYSWLYPDTAAATELPESAAVVGSAAAAAPSASKAPPPCGRVAGEYVEVRVNDEAAPKDSDEEEEEEDEEGESGDEEDEEEGGDGHGRRRRRGRRRKKKKEGPLVRQAWSYIKKAWMGAIHRSGQPRKARERYCTILLEKALGVGRQRLVDRIFSLYMSSYYNISAFGSGILVGLIPYVITSAL